MKKIGLLSLILASTTFGASIDHVQNYTAEYNANPAQQGAINRNTSVFFNPAGITRLEEGTYVTGGLQLAFGTETTDYTKKSGEKSSYDGKLMAPIPNLSIYKVTGDKSYYWTFGPQAGGGELPYDDGVSGVKILEDLPLGAISPTLAGVTATANKGTNATGENMYAQTTLGTAWKVNEKLSLSVAGRLVYGWRNLDAHLDATLHNVPNGTGGTIANVPLVADIDSERTAWGIGAQFGLNYAPNEIWNIGMRYDSPIKMEFEANTKSTTTVPGLGFEMFFPQYADGAKFRRDLPGLLAIGASQKITDKWTMFYGGNYYFNEAAKIDKEVPGHHVEYDNGWEISVGTEYWINEKVALLAGANYAETGAGSETYSDVEFALDSTLVGVGVKYRSVEDTEWVVSASHYFYKDGSNQKYPSAVTNALEYSKNISSIGVSYTKKF